MARSPTSSLRSRSGGRSIRWIDSRRYRSARKRRPSASASMVVAALATSRQLMSVGAPSTLTSPSRTTRVSRAWTDAGNSSMPSRNSVPPRAAARRESRRISSRSPDVRVLHMPKSSSSMRSCLQSTATNGADARQLRRCRSRAIASVSAPGSDTSSTPAPLEAASASRCRTRSIASGQLDGPGRHPMIDGFDKRSHVMRHGGSRGRNRGLESSALSLTGGRWIPANPMGGTDTISVNDDLG